MPASAGAPVTRRSAYAYVWALGNRIVELFSGNKNNGAATESLAVPTDRFQAPAFQSFFLSWIVDDRCFRPLPSSILDKSN